MSCHIHNFSSYFYSLLIFLIPVNCAAYENNWHTIAGWQYEFMHIFNKPHQWMLEQIHADLKSLTPSQMKSDALDRFMQEHEKECANALLVRISIRANHVLVLPYAIPLHPAHVSMQKTRLDWTMGALMQLAKCTTLPNVDFILCLDDAFNIDIGVPVFGFAKNPNLGRRTILIPDFEALNGNENLLRSVHFANNCYPWEHKKKRAIFRGALTGGDFNEDSFLTFPRSKAITYSLQFPDLIDARFSYYEGWEGFKSCYGDYFSPSMPIEDQIVYKYQLLIDGNSCAYSRAYWQLFSNCVILKQVSENIQWFYRAFLPFVHFIPVNQDMSDLPEMINWALQHDAEAHQISSQTQQFAKNNVSYARIMQYLHLVLVEYAALQR